MQENEIKQILDNSLNTNLSEYIPVIMFAFFIVIAVGVWDTHKRWNRIANYYRTKQRLGHNEKYDAQRVWLDGRQFGNLVVVPTEQGLYMAHWGLLPQIMMPKRVLIPWASFSKIFSKKRSALGFTVEEFFLNISGSTTVELKIPPDVAKEILQKNYLKQE